MKQKSAKKSGLATTSFVEVADIRAPFILLKDGSLRAAIAVQSVNFDLKSTDEQVGILQGFQSFLNSLDFPLEIVVHSRRLDLAPYLASLTEVSGTITNDLLKVQMEEYTRFVKGLSELANIMTKTFYAVVPYRAIEDEATKKTGLRGLFSGIFGTKHHPTRLTESLLDTYRSQIDQRISVVIAGLSPLGVTCHLAESDELTKLFHAYYT